MLDTGVNSSVVNYSYGYDFINDDDDPFDDHGHGTMVASVIEAIAPDAELIVAKVINENGTGYESDVLAGLQYCINQDPDIILLSIGTNATCTGFCDVDFVANMSNNAVEQEIFVVASAGNDGGKNLSCPACGSKVFSVGATDDNDNIAPFSNVNPTLDLFAPGVNITVPAGTGSGTSMSAPHVAAAAALIFENEELNVSELKYRLRSTGKAVEHIYNETITVNIGRLDIYNSLVDNKTMEPYDYSWWWHDDLVTDPDEEGDGDYEPQDCFLPGTKINLADGSYKNIEDVQVDETVKVFNEQTQTIENASVTSTQTKMHNDVHELHLADGTILKPTANHPFLTKEKGWATISGLDEMSMNAGKLEIGDHIYSLQPDGTLKEVQVADIVPVECDYLTYKFVDMKYDYSQH